MLTELAREIDRIVGEGPAVLTEGRERLRINRLRADDARIIYELMIGGELDEVVLEDDGGPFSIEQLHSDSEGIAVSARMPTVPLGVHPVITWTAFNHLLERPPEAPVVWVLGLNRAFETRTIRYCQWHDTTAFEPFPDTREVRRVVRILQNDVPEDAGLGRWLLRDPNAEVPEGWRRIAARRLAVGMAQEVEPDGILLFRGPPSVRFDLAAGTVSDAALRSLQLASSWVYENDREVESRHGLIAAEVSRASLRSGTIGDLADISALALDGARIAYSFGIQRQSHEALKALSDLRKSVSDETVKLADATRGLAGAVTGAVVGNIGLLIARFTLPAAQPFLIPLGAVLALYVAVAIINGRHFLKIQSDLRAEWKPKLYRYLTEAEYDRLVENPARRAENGFNVVSIGGGVMAALLLTAVLWVTFGVNKDESSSLEPERPTELNQSVSEG